MPPRKTPAKGTADDPIIHLHEHKGKEPVRGPLKVSRERVELAIADLDPCSPERKKIQELVWCMARHLHLSAAASPARDQAAIVAQGLRYLQLGCALDGQDLPLTRAGLAESTQKAAESTLRQALALAHTEEEKDLALTMLARLGGKEAEERAPPG